MKSAMHPANELVRKAQNVEDPAPLPAPRGPRCVAARAKARGRKKRPGPARLLFLARLALHGSHK